MNFDRYFLRILAEILSDQYGYYYGSFDADMLTWSDEKLEQYVDDLLEKERKEKSRNL